MGDPCSSEPDRRSRVSAAPAAILVALAALSPQASEREDRQERLRGMQKEIVRLEAELHDLEGRESGLIGELERLGGELRLHEAKLEEVALRREAVAASIEAHSRRLDALERAQAGRKAYLGFRLREIYKSGPDQALRRFVGEAGIERYWDAVRYAAYLSERDARVLRSYRLDAHRIRTARAELEGEQRVLDATRDELERSRTRLEASRRSRSGLIDEIRQDQNKRRVALNELETASGELGRLVAALDPAAAAPTLDVQKFRGLLDWPCAGEVSAGFGSVVHPRFKTRVPHPGLDIDAPLGTRIRAVFDGHVVFAAWMRGYGLTAIVDHGKGLLSIYAHASVLMVEPGERVGRGELIGAVGDTGSLRGPYLYFELREEGKPIDPDRWLRPR